MVRRQTRRNDRGKPTRPGQPFVVISFWDQQTSLATWLSDREGDTDNSVPCSRGTKALKMLPQRASPSKMLYYLLSDINPR
jgi:hypothetical protein